MLKECIEIFRQEMETKNGKLVLDTYVPADGTYIIVGKDGKINTGDLNKNLENIEGLTHEGVLITDNPIGSLPTTVVVDGNNLIIQENGNVVVSEWMQTGYEITNGKITVKVGDYVSNYDELSNGIQN